MDEKNENRITVRLNKDAKYIVDKAVEDGCCKSVFINQCIVGNNMHGNVSVKRIVKHLCQVNEAIEHIGSDELREEIKKEVREVWLALK